MQLKTILNRVQKFKSFVYGDVEWEEVDGNRVLVVEIWPRQNSRPICSGCRRAGPGYDTLQARLFELCRCGASPSFSPMGCAEWTADGAA